MIIRKDTSWLARTLPSLRDVPLTTKAGPGTRPLPPKASPGRPAIFEAPMPVAVIHCIRTAVRVPHEAPPGSSKLWIPGISLWGGCPMAWKNRAYRNCHIQLLLIDSWLRLAPVPYGSGWELLDAYGQWSGRNPAGATYDSRYPAAKKDLPAYLSAPFFRSTPSDPIHPLHVAF